MADEPSSWRLLRTAVLSIGDPPRGLSFRLTNGEATAISLKEISIDGKAVGTLSLAFVPLADAPVIGETYHVPEQARRDAEAALEFACRLLALEYGTTHRICTPRPGLGLHCDDTHAMEALEGTQVDLPFAHMALSGVSEAGLFSGPSLLAGLADRPDGVLMLTEALNAGSPLGQFLQLWRLFERAFHRGHVKTGPLLVDFLQGSPHGFEQDEIDEWVGKRNPSVHADRNQIPVLDSDVQRDVGRMREAAYDVLLNKAEWATPTVKRSDRWSASCGTSDRSGMIFGMQGKTWTLQGQILDDFAAYPLLLAGPVEDLLPAACWLLPDDDSGPSLWLRGNGVVESK